MKQEFSDIEQTLAWGEHLGRILAGGDVIELRGDVGAGKTTLVKGIAKGLDIAGTIQSPTFTINHLYEVRDGLRLMHYDFYRLSDPGIMREELAESLDDPLTITILEWADVVEGVLPENRLTITLLATDEMTREVQLTGSDELIARLQEAAT